MLLTAPLSSTTEIEALYTSNVIDIESALPSALHSLGASAVEIEGALKRRRLADDKKANPETLMAENNAKLGEYDAKLKEAQTAKTLAETEKVRAEVGAINEAAAPSGAAAAQDDAEPKKARA